MIEIANEVEIQVVAHDRTGAGFAAAEARAKKLAASLTGSIGRAGRDAGTQLADGVDAGMQRAARDADKRGREVVQRFGRSATKDAAATGAKLGGSLATSFGEAAQTMFARSGVVGAAAVVAGLTALPAVAGTIGGLVGASFGAGLAGIGIAAAAQSDRVKAEFADLKDDVVSGVRGISGPLEQSLLKIPDVVRRTGSDLRPFLAGVFADTAPAIDRFVVAVGKGVSSLGPSFRSLGKGFSTVLDAIGQRAPEIFEDIGSGLETFAQLAVDHADDIAGAFKAISQAFESSADALKWFSEQFGPSADLQAEFTRGLVEAAGGVDAFRRQMAALGEPSAAVEASLVQAGLVTRDVGTAAREASADVSGLGAAFDELNAKFLDVEEAKTRFADVLAEATKAIGENGEAWKLNSEAGRENREEVYRVARAAQDVIAKMGEQKATIGEVTSTYLGYRQQLVGTLVDAGKTRQAAEELATQLLGVPDSIQTELRANASDLSGKIAAAKQQLKDPNLTRPQASEIRARIDKLVAARDRAVAALASIRDKSVTITAKYVTIRELVNRGYSGNSVTGGTAHGGVIGSSMVRFKPFQTGGIAGATGAGSATALVGEQGPELVRLPVGSTVIPAGQSASMMSASAARAASSISLAFRPGQSRGGDGASGDVAKSIKDLTKELRDIIGLREGMSRFTDGVMGQGRAFMAYEAALDRAAASAKKNGKTLNIGREKGRENRSALMDMAQAAHEAAFAMHNLGRPASAIVARMKEQRAEFIRVARLMGLTTKQAKELADKWGLLPSTVKSVLAKETKDKAYNRAAEKFNATLKAKASGGPAGGMTLVGESGPELVRLPFGSSVVPAGQTAGMMGGGSGVLHVTLQIGATQLGELVIDPLRKSIRTRGGNVQAVLGRG